MVDKLTLSLLSDQFNRIISRESANLPMNPANQFFSRFFAFFPQINYSIQAKFKCALSNQRYYFCRKCSTPVLPTVAVESDQYHGGLGPAFLVHGTINTKMPSPAYQVQFTTGIYIVSDVLCIGCDQLVGKQYEHSFDAANGYKVGKTLLEQTVVCLPPCCRGDFVWPEFCTSCRDEAISDMDYYVHHVTHGFRDLVKTKQLLGAFQPEDCPPSLRRRFVSMLSRILLFDGNRSPAMLAESLATRIALIPDLDKDWKKSINFMDGLAGSLVTSPGASALVSATDRYSLLGAVVKAFVKFRDPEKLDDLLPETRNSDERIAVLTSIAETAINENTEEYKVSILRRVLTRSNSVSDRYSGDSLDMAWPFNGRSPPGPPARIPGPTDLMR
jgi:hypothetical protein